MNIRRILVCSLLVVGIPQLIGFLSAFSFLLHQQTATPPWVHSARVASSWLGVVLVFAYLFVVQRRRTFTHVASVTLLAWFVGTVLSVVMVQFLNALPTAPETIQSDLLDGVGRALAIEVLRAMLGCGLGLTYLGLRRRPVGMNPASG